MPNERCIPVTDRSELEPLDKHDVTLVGDFRSTPNLSILSVASTQILVYFLPNRAPPVCDESIVAVIHGRLVGRKPKGGGSEGPPPTLFDLIDAHAVAVGAETAAVACPSGR